MPDETTSAETRPRFRRGRIGVGITLALLVIMAVTLAYVWVRRVPIANSYIAQALAARDVRASYRLTKISGHTQRIENVVLGDPAQPDLTARVVEVDIGYGALLPRVVAVRAQGVRLYGRVKPDGTLSLGELDKFRSTDSAAPFSFPDIALSLRDTRVRIETPVGPLGLSVEGAGNLQSGFRGKLAGVMRNLRVGDCSAPLVSAYVDVRMVRGGPHLAGPVRSKALGCPGAGVTLSDGSTVLDVQFGKALDRMEGTARLAAGAAKVGGALVTSPVLDVRLHGTPSDMNGRFALRSGPGAYAAARIKALRSDGVWAYHAGTVSLAGQGGADNLALLDSVSVRALRAGGAGTPVAPLAVRLADALEASARDNRLQISFSLTQKGRAGSIAISRLVLDSHSGARIALSEGGRFDARWPGGRWALTGGATSEGGGLPRAALHLAPGANGGVAGQIFLDPYVAGSAKLSAKPARFSVSAGGAVKLSTVLSLDGPLPGGTLRGLTLPLVLTAKGGVMQVNPGCTPIGLTSVHYGALTTGATRMTLCGRSGRSLLTLTNGRMSGGATVQPLRLTGHLGNSPMRLSADRGMLQFADGAFMLDRAELLLGSGQPPIRLAAARLDGRPAARGLGGSASGIEGRIGSVPLLVQEGSAKWGYAAGALRLAGSIGVIDAANPDRFNPLVSPDFQLSLVNNRIIAGGTLMLPKGSTPVARVAIRHDLGSARGSADLTVEALRFGPGLQPEDITHLALGVVANVRGVVNGSGRIDWSGDRVTSTGEFATENADLAAAFGPVSGLSAHIRFTDLIGLVTAPGQVATMRSVNPGVEVRDGKLVYALLPGQRVGIENAHWPFAGGDLTLLPGVLDFAADRPRNLTFRVVGLDAGAFINTLELENISATGTFDGLLPMVFDASGGRIVGGILVARQAGMPPLVIDHVEGLNVPCDPSRKSGTLSYVGQVSNENLGRFGKMAFDALKDLQYKCLTILMDGAIDGEVVTQVAFNGVNRGELSSMPKLVSRKFIGLPFIFNIRIQAPFRGLINTARSFVDPSLLIRSQLGDEFAPVIENRLAVQPSESDTNLSGDRK